MKTEPNSKALYGENAVCERCGKFGAYQFDGATLCADCYQGAGSCCPEFGADDLWTTNEEAPTDAAKR